MNSRIFLICFLYSFFLLINILFIIYYRNCREYDNIKSKFLFFPIMYIIFSSSIIFLCIKNNIGIFNFCFITLSNKILSFCFLFYTTCFIEYENINIFYIYSYTVSILLFFIGIIYDLLFCVFQIQTPNQTPNQITPFLIGNIRKTDIEDITDCCSICIEQYKLDEQLHIFNCNHKIHLECSKELLLHEHIRCPLCRLEIF